MDNEWKPTKEDWKKLMEHVEDSPSRAEFQVLKIQVDDMHTGFFNGGCASQRMTRQRLTAITVLLVGMWGVLTTWLGWLHNYTVEHFQAIAKLLGQIVGRN